MTSSWLEDILYGALSSGVNRPTVLLLNAALLGCIASLVYLLVITLHTAPGLAIHVGFLLVMAITLLILINWFLSEVGLVRAEDQRLELFGTDSKAPHLQESSRAEEPPILTDFQEQDIKKKQ